jgi:protoheme IX farnesyltransferase
MEPATYPATGELETKDARPSRSMLWKSLMVLFKIRVVILLLFAAVAGAFLASAGWPGAGTLALLLFAGGSASAGASAINQYLEKDLDERMERTSRRPLAARSLAQPRRVLWVGAVMILLPSLLVLPFNPALSVFLVLGAVIYIGIYTLWLKPRTPLNIVIGGAAGSAAVLSGSAAAGAWNDPGALLLALLVFLWTPTHFWSLAIAYREDYARGGFPMLPVQTTPRAAAWWVLVNTGGATAAAVALATHPALGWLYLVPVVVAASVLAFLNIRLIVEPSRHRALTLFHASNLYLATVLIMVCVNTLVSQSTMHQTQKLLEAFCI